MISLLWLLSIWAVYFCQNIDILIIKFNYVFDLEKNVTLHELPENKHQQPLSAAFGMKVKLSFCLSVCQSGYWTIKYARIYLFICRQTQYMCGCVYVHILFFALHELNDYGKILNTSILSSSHNTG